MIKYKPLPQSMIPNYPKARRPSLKLILFISTLLIFGSGYIIFVNGMATFNLDDEESIEIINFSEEFEAGRKYQVGLMIDMLRVPEVKKFIESSNSPMIKKASEFLFNQDKEMIIEMLFDLEVEK